MDSTEAGPVILALFVVERAGLPMRRISSVEAIAGRGLAGDRYAQGTGYYSGRNECQVTAIEAEAIARMEAKFGVRMSAGEHRRNLVTCGVSLPELAGWRVQIGEAVLEFDRSRPPCGYLERLTEPRVVRAMGEGAGIGLTVVRGGTLREGDAVIVLAEPARRPRRHLP